MAGRGKNHILDNTFLRAIAKPVVAELGTQDRILADRLFALFEMSGPVAGKRVRLSVCLTTLFPRFEERKAVTALTDFRSRFNQAAEEKGVELRFRRG